MESGTEIESRPSENKQVPYLIAYKNPGEISGMDYKIYEGYWMIMKPISEIDQAWESIKVATENGELGLRSSVRTAMILEGEPAYEKKLISVFSYAEDTKTEQEKLLAVQEMGFDEGELQFKPIASRGQYYHLGDRDFCEPSSKFLK